MKKNKNLWWFLGGAAIVGVGFFAFKRFTKKGEKKAEEIKQKGLEAPTDIVVKPDTPTTTITPTTQTTTQMPPTGNWVADISNTISNLVTNFQPYEVVTKNSTLNVRSKPDAQSKIVGSLKRGSTIRARASGVKGWFAVSDNDKDVKGFVSSIYLKSKTK